MLFAIAMCSKHNYYYLLVLRIKQNKIKTRPEQKMKNKPEIRKKFRVYSQHNR